MTKPPSNAEHLYARLPLRLYICCIKLYSTCGAELLIEIAANAAFPEYDRVDGQVDGVYRAVFNTEPTFRIAALRPI